MRNHYLYVTSIDSLSKNYRGQTESNGVTATDKSFQDCFSFIETYTCKWANAIDHPEIIKELKTMNYKNKGKKDLGVSFGWALYHANMKQGVRQDKQKQSEENVYFHENIV